MIPRGNNRVFTFVKNILSTGTGLDMRSQCKLPICSNTFTKVLMILRSVIHTFAVSQKNSETGVVTKDKRRLGFQLCRDSIGGAWAEIAEEELLIKPLSGGLTNEVFICSIPSDRDVPSGQPESLLLRVYGEIMSSSDFVLRNSVVFALMSEKRMGPRLYGMNTQARIEELLPCKSLATAQLSDPTLSQIIARKLAQVHSLNMPLCKEPRFLFDQMDQWINQAGKILKQNHSPQDQHLVNKIKSYNLEYELEVLKNILASINSKVVFCHNDLQEGNILMTENCNDKESALTVIDWEYCAYNHRGFDFGNHFCEWTYDYSVKEEPYYSCKPENYPTAQQQKIFFRAYLSELGQDITEEELDKMCLEADTFALASHFFWALWSVVQNDKSNIQFGFLAYADSRLQDYFKMKHRLQVMS